jgi:Co/Zn/Cd efflux system component
MGPANQEGTQLSGCCDHDHGSVRFEGASTAYRRVLMVVIALNAGMFLAEVIAGVAAGSLALFADSLDFAADAATYAITLLVIGKSVRVRTNAALAKGLSLMVMATLVLGGTAWRVLVQGVPDSLTMGIVAVAALVINAASVLLLLKWRDGDANVRSVWLCSRNDAIGNVLVLVAASGVFATSTRWPDLAVAAAMAALFLTSSVKIVRQALAERAVSV